MPIAQSRVTSQGQISIPTKVRQKLGIGPGSMIEWDVDGERIVVRKAGRYDLKDARNALGFRTAPRSRSLKTLTGGLRAAARKRHARR